MKKIISLFMRNYEGDRLVRDEVVSVMTEGEREKIGEEYGDALLGSPAALRHVSRHIPALLAEIDRLEKERDEATEILANIHREALHHPAWEKESLRQRLRSIGYWAESALKTRVASSPGRERE